MIALIVRMKAAKGKEGEVEERLRKAAAWTQENEKGTTLQFNVHRKADDPSEFFIYEQYKDRDAWLVIHRSSEHYKKSRETSASLYAAPPEIVEYEVLEPIA